MNNRLFGFATLLVAAVLFPHSARAQFQSSIAFENGTGQSALVKLVGPSTRQLSVPDHQTRSESGVAPGRYHIVVRFGDSEANYSYMEGDPFDVEEVGDEYSEISITLQKVENGNYGSRPARRDEFERPQ